jgi:hypothetical protein
MPTPSYRDHEKQAHAKIKSTVDDLRPEMQMINDPAG